jgi:hypothetical protein
MTAAFASLLTLSMVEQPVRVEASAQPSSALVVLELNKYFGVFINFSIGKVDIKLWEVRKAYSTQLGNLELEAPASGSAKPELRHPGD